jgi:DNA-3-methyladenine glycosylase II
MKLPLVAKPPFSFAQTLTFIRRFPPCQGQYVLTGDTLTAAVTVDGGPTWFTIIGGHTVEVERAAQAPALLARAVNLVGARDDLGDFYAAARGDSCFWPLVEELFGLHHVRFLTLEEIAVYSVMMQRNPVTRAAAMKRRFFERFGLPVDVAGTTLRALPAIEELAKLDGATIGEAIGHSAKGEVIANVVRGIAKIGEKFLCEAPYEVARDELLEVPGIGPFSAAAILLRGLGRMDDLPNLEMFEETARIVYGDAYDAAAIRRRYGRQLGYWSVYLKTGVARSPVWSVQRDRARPRRVSRARDERVR